MLFVILGRHKKLIVYIFFIGSNYQSIIQILNKFRNFISCVKSVNLENFRNLFNLYVNFKTDVYKNRRE